MDYYFIFGFYSIVSANLNTRYELVESAVEITSKYYEHQSVTSVIWTDNNSEEISIFLRKYEGSVVITPLFHNNTNVIFETVKTFGYSQTIFFTSEPDTFEKFISLVNKYVKYHIKLVLILEKPISELMDLLVFTRIAWRNGLVNIVILCKNYNDEMIISTYCPYSNGMCDNDLPIKINTGQNMFPNKFLNFNKCPIRLRALPFLPYADPDDIDTENGIITRIGGYDGITLSHIAQYLNATLDVKLAIKNEGQWNNTYGTFIEGRATGGFSDLVYNKADILIPAGMLTLSRYAAAQASHIYHTLDIRWIGPKRREMHDGIKLMLPFMTVITPVLYLTYAVFVSVAVLIRKRKNGNVDKKKSISYQAFALLLGQTINYETKILLLNSLFLIWIWFCFLIRIAYQGELVQFLQTELLEPPFTTIEEAVTRVNGFGGSATIIEHYRDTPLEQNFKILGLLDLLKCLEHIGRGARFLLATDTFFIGHNRYSYQILDTQVSSASACLFMRRGWPAAELVDSVINRLVESGIVEKIRYNNIVTLHQEVNKNEMVHPLDMTMLCACFYGLACMGVLCFAIFLCEIIYYKYECFTCKRKQLLI
ncbi:unnamed protein product [Arctia plantaginis]|uniref:Uncharacterized protein n=1 Tax=Arctia plantaginis TaxID=874455 RepID=A0A8S0ZBQ1_ARCPL|nr:unnamed protein product [Arctia plantaginis]